MRDPQELQHTIKSVEDWRKISDNLFQLGPLKVGLDGVLTWFPGVGDVYSLGASGFLLYHAAKAGASRQTMTKMALLMGTDAVIGAVPLLGDAFDFVFRAHARSARMLLKELKSRPEAGGMDPVPTGRSSPVPTASQHRGPNDQAELEQVRRVEALRAQVQQGGGGIDARRR